MTEELSLKVNLFSTKGILGRREFLLSGAYIGMISSVFLTPLTYVLVLPSVFNVDVDSYGFKTLWVIAIVATTLLSLPSVVKRINDINGKVDKRINILLSILIVAFALLYAVEGGFILYIMCLSFGAFLLFKKGKITSKYAHNTVNEFNWGAFFGTWIWGICNKSYKTLWMIPLSITPLGGYFALVCGLKGNKWAIKNKDWNNNKEFKDSQETQSIVFSVLALLVYPIILTFLIIFISFAVVFKIADDSVKDPEKGKVTMQRMEKFLENIESKTFESYEISSTENRFYIAPNTWYYLSYSDRMKTLDLAANIASKKRTDKYKQKNCSTCYSYSKTTELPRTKIYSAKNHELLAEYSSDATTNLSKKEKVSIADIIIASTNTYKFYEPSNIK